MIDAAEQAIALAGGVQPSATTCRCSSTALRAVEADLRR
jgi:hypothetical protein